MGVLFFKGLGCGNVKNGRLQSRGVQPYTPTGGLVWGTAWGGGGVVGWGICGRGAVVDGVVGAGWQ
jgi:hypothetical protein